MSLAEQLRVSAPPEAIGRVEAVEEHPIANNGPDYILPSPDYLNTKYLFERILGCILLVPASPVILIVCLLIKLTSRGPAIYRQVRMGHNQCTYEILKLRTMRLDAESDGVARWCVKNDPRVTPLGRILRRFHLDEFPQLINVARGEMVLVGPRPERPQICAKLAEDIDGYYNRLLVKPGITGLAQINLPPDETLDDARRKQTLDMLYIEEASLWLDLRMLVATLLRIMGIRGPLVMRAMGLCRKSKLGALGSPVRTAIRDVEENDLSVAQGTGCLVLEGGDQSHRYPATSPRRPR